MQISDPDTVQEYINFLQKEVKRLEAENFTLAAGQCVHNLIGDEWGHFECSEVTTLKAELQKREWISVETEPEETGDYLCKMVDTRDEYDDEWFEVNQFTVLKGFKSSWCVADFDAVDEWTHIPG